MEIVRSIEIMKSLADTSRLRIINSLIDKSQYVEELSHRLNLAISTVSFHLKKLEAAGLVTHAKEQYYIMYSINEEVFGLTLKELIDFEDIEKYAHEERMNQYRQKVHKAFFKKNKLVKIPVQKKKMLIVLDEFAGKFKAEKKYSEDEINKIIMSVYDDYCTIRRLLIEEKYMRRDKQVYWLNHKN